MFMGMPWVIDHDGDEGATDEPWIRDFDVRDGRACRLRFRGPVASLISTF